MDYSNPRAMAFYFVAKARQLRMEGWPLFYVFDSLNAAANYRRKSA